MVNFDTFRNEIKEIHKKRKTYDVFIKQTLLGFLKDVCKILRDGVDTIANPEAHFQIERVMVDYAHLYNVVYHYNEPGQNYPRKIKVFNIEYYPGGDINLEVNLWSTNEYEGTYGMEMRENLLNYLFHNNIFTNIVKQLNTILPMVKDLQTKQKNSESEMWATHRKRTEQMFGEVYNLLLNGKTITLTEPYDFTYGNRTFFGDEITFTKQDGKRNGVLVINNLTKETNVSWEKLPLNSLARIARDLLYHEKNIGE